MNYTKRILRKADTAKRLLGSKNSALRSAIGNSKMYTAAGDYLFNVNNIHATTEKYFILKDGMFKKTSDYAVVLHLYYTDNWKNQFGPKLKRLASKVQFDLYITMPETNKEYIRVVRKSFESSNILIVPNRGRDVLPFIKTAQMLHNMGYKKVLKIHSKKSSHRETSNTSTAGGGDLWLSNTLNALIPEDDKVLDKILQKIKDKNTGMIGSMEYYYPIKMYLRHNRPSIERILKKYVDASFFTAAVSKSLDRVGYFGGTMFWIDLDAIAGVLSVSMHNFQKEKGQYDRTMAHALERIFCILPQLEGKILYGVSGREVTKIRNGDGKFPGWYFGDVSGGKPQISIIVPVYADWSSLSINIASLRKVIGNSEDVSVHYVNDCGPQADMLESKIIKNISGLTNFYYYRNNTNMGFVRTCNRSAFELVNQKDDVLLLNSDTKVTKDFLVEMRRILYSEPNIGAVTARSNNATVWSVPMNGRLANHRIVAYLVYQYLKREIPEKYITPTIHGFCVLIRREVINKYGLFDEVYGKGYGEENDFAMRIREHGWKCAVANGAFVFHYESRSFGNTERNRQIEKNEKILLERYPNYRSLVQEYWDGVREPLK